MFTHSGEALGFTEEGNPQRASNTDEPRGHFAQRSQPVTERQTLYDSTYVRPLKWSSVWGQKVGWWLLGVGENSGYRALVLQEEAFRKTHSNVNVLNTPDQMGHVCVSDHDSEYSTKCRFPGPSAHCPHRMQQLWGVARRPCGRSPSESATKARVPHCT